ncbi:MAG: hypothetical protein COS94_04090 [Candidatus Hydrogenedentes bacterium CG07_land_8_20_14_0_80_42_17]|nr:MAG: hypothetical protein AUJ18_05210 [Candidatus Hydrogenedentes bacterium CG1_02_42_14]PIU48074.1 MAG: hypothetical protein COS94_04090 [Candidatus Hydrogenedentes bacterium CG07_land_8_20_14_0_80_42_17]
MKALLFLLFISSNAYAENNLHLYSSRLVNTDNDSLLELAVSWKNDSGTGGVTLLKREGVFFKEVSKYSEKNYTPFFVRTGDIDNDRKIELLVGAFDRAIGGRNGFTKKIHIFKIEENSLKPFWFSEREYDDFECVRIGEKNYLLELKKVDGNTSVSIFLWDSFGLWQSHSFISSVPLSIERIHDEILLKGENGKYLEFFELDGKISVRIYGVNE